MCLKLSIHIIKVYDQFLISHLTISGLPGNPGAQGPAGPEGPQGDLGIKVEFINCLECL